MDTNETRKHSELTSEQLFGLLANLPEDTSGDSDQPRRRCGHWLLRASVELHYTEPGGTAATQSVDIRDISVLGVGIICKAPLPIGTEASLVLPLEDGSCKVALQVAHCTETPEGHRIGCLLLLPDMPAMMPIGRSCHTLAGV